MKRRDVLKLTGAALLHSAVPRLATAQTSSTIANPRFGATSLTLGPPGRENALLLRRFLRSGWFPHVTPTNAQIWWNQTALHVIFDNTELDPLYRGNPGLAKPIHYPRTGRFDLSSYPDAVYVQFRHGWAEADKVQVFAVDSSGAQNSTNFQTEVVRRKDGWTASFTLPWSLLGGRPETGAFGLNLIRSRGQSSEVLSPVALDQSLEVNADLLMSTSFGARPAVRTAEAILCTLPDGTQRWQLPAELIAPTESELLAFWQQQQQLSMPTRPELLPERVALAQRLHELLILEGFSFHTDGSNWRVLPGEFYPNQARADVNAALCARDFAVACSLLDVYLGQLDRTIRGWFADGSPGNVRSDQWVVVTAAGAPEQQGNELRLPLLAGNERINLFLSSACGAIRLRSERIGNFNPASSTLPTPSNLRIEAHTGSPWKIAVLDDNGPERWSLRQGQLFVRLSNSGEILAIDLRRTLAPEENLYGFGERFNALGQRGHVVTLWDVDSWDGLIHGRLNQAYKNIPLMHSTAGHSLFWNSTYRLRADVGRTHDDQLRLTIFGDILDLFIWPSTPTQAMAGYTQLTGSPILPPDWAFEPWMGGGGRRWSNGPLKNAVRQELAVVERFRALDIPHSAIYAEAGNANPELYAGLKGTSIHVLAWVYASMKFETIRTLLPAVAETDLPILHHCDGSIARRLDDGAAILDYTHPRIHELITKFWQPRFDLGLAGSMVDFGDVVPEDAVFYNGKTGAEMHNFYAHSYHAVYRDVFRTARGDDYMLFARSACAGDQHAIGYFAGDHQANMFGMRGALRGGLNAAACGLSTWGADAGGYFGWPDPETYIRWTEWAAFCPLMRFHGTTPREPWEYGDDAVTIYRRFAWLRQSFHPYILAAARQAQQTGVSIMRPMPFAFPQMHNAIDCDDQYMFGDDLLIAPMLSPGNAREVHLPSGTWTDFWTGREFSGNRTIMLPVPLDSIGVLLRAGAAIPLDLPASLVPGESMTPGRVRAILATRPDQGPWRIATNDAQFLIRYTNGRRVVTALHGEAQWNEPS